MLIKNKLITLAFCTSLAAMQPTVVNGQERSNTTEQSDSDDDGFDYGWIGLIGFAGLLGLRKRDRDDRDARSDSNVRH